MCHLRHDLLCLHVQRDATRYVRFKDHRDALRCIEALTPTDPEEAEKDEKDGKG